MYRQFIRRNISSVAIILFIVVFSTIQIMKPSFLYEKNGAIRKFGIGRKKKTILPIWFLTIILSFLSYCIIHYYLELPKII